MVLKRTLVCCLAFVFALSGCATKVIPAYQAKSVSAYRLSDTKDGLTIAVHPITDEEESEKFFGTNLIETGILAVMIVAKNADTGSSKTLFSENISFIQGSTTSSTKTSDQFGKSAVGQGVSMVGAVGLVLSPIIAFPVLFVGFKMMSDATVVKHNMERKVFRSKTLSAGKQAGGFVYFKLPEVKSGTNEIWTLRIEATDMKSGDIVEFDFKINLEEIKNENKKST